MKICCRTGIVAWSKEVERLVEPTDDDCGSIDALALGNSPWSPTHEGKGYHAKCLEHGGNTGLLKCICLSKSEAQLMLCDYHV